MGNRFGFYDRAEDEQESISRSSSDRFLPSENPFNTISELACADNRAGSSKVLKPLSHRDEFFCRGL